SGSGTTGIAASLLNRNFLGIEKEDEFLDLSKRRREEIDDAAVRQAYRERIMKSPDKPLERILEVRTPTLHYGLDLPLA
ncbi:MAG: site-specific DNA-methyltransferase, partial [Treponema sp.]|nr:site-specific DNA-methyltransferase [Treponema sp.]